MSELESLGLRLAGERSAKGLSQKDFADLMRVHQNTQTAYEKGRRAVPADYFFRAAELGIDIGYVLTGRRSDQPACDEDARFLARFHQLGERERRAVAQLVDNLNAAAPNPGSIAATVDPDQIATARGAVAPVLHESRPDFRREQD